jgi:hypothetical protein
VVYIPPGYGHYVANARWCLKGSLHLIEQKDSLDAAMALHVLGPRIFGARNAEDYSDLCVVCMGLCTGLCVCMGLCPGLCVYWIVYHDTTWLHACMVLPH